MTDDSLAEVAPGLRQALAQAKDAGHAFVVIDVARTYSSPSARSPVAATAAWREVQKVEFDITQGQKGPQAENVKVIG